MNNKNVIFVLINCFWFSNLFSQKELTIGDTFPDLEIKNVYFQSDSSIRLKNLKAKLIILDFWSYNCSSCIIAMPKADLIQKKFQDDVKILTVIPMKSINSTTKNYLDSFWRNNKFTKNTSLPVVMDTILYQKYFKPDGVPFIVWLDKDRIIKGMTTIAYLNEREIPNVLAGRYPSWEINKKIDIDYTKPVFSVQNERASEKKSSFYSALSGFMPRTRFGSFELERSEDKARFYTMNMAIKDLYLSLIAKLSKPTMPTIKLVTNFEHPINFSWDSTKGYKEIWYKNNSYCYEATFPGSMTDQQIYRYVLQDFNRFFNLSGRLEKRMEDCFVISKSPTQNIATNVSGNNNSLREHLSLNNDLIMHESMSNLLSSLNQENFNYPFIDETGYSENINLEIPRQILNNRDIATIRKILNSRGFDINLKKRGIEYLVLQN